MTTELNRLRQLAGVPTLITESYDIDGQTAGEYVEELDISVNQEDRAEFDQIIDNYLTSDSESYLKDQVNRLPTDQIKALINDLMMLHYDLDEQFDTDMKKHNERIDKDEVSEETVDFDPSKSIGVHAANYMRKVTFIGHDKWRATHNKPEGSRATAMALGRTKEEADQRAEYLMQKYAEKGMKPQIEPGYTTMNGGMNIRTEQGQMREWSNSVAGDVEDRGNYQEQPDGETIDNSLRRYLNAEAMKVSVQESHTDESMLNEYNAFKEDSNLGK